MPNFSPEVIWGVIGVGATVGSALFHIILYIGKLVNRVDRHEDRINDHESDIQKLKRMGV